MQWIAGFKVPCAVTDSVPRVEKALWILDLEMALRPQGLGNEVPLLVWSVTFKMMKTSA